MQRDEAIALIRSSALAEYSDALERHLAPSVRLIVHNEPELSEGCLAVSHFGGLPSLPEGVAWPLWDKREFLKAEIASTEKRSEAYRVRTEGQPERIPGLRERRLAGFREDLAKMRQQFSQGQVPLAFLGQVSLREIAAEATLPGWPSRGVLTFFYDADHVWGYSPLHRGHCRVFYSSVDLPFTSAEFPDALNSRDRYPQRFLKAQCEWVLPTDLELGDVDFGRMEEYGELVDKLSSGSQSGTTPLHRCGGYAQEIQGDMRLECQLVTHGINCGGPEGYKDPRRAELEPGAADWQLLMQFDSDENGLGWMWGDVGRVYFWARRQQIDAADFTNSWAILQCG